MDATTTKRQDGAPLEFLKRQDHDGYQAPHLRQQQNDGVRASPASSLLSSQRDGQVAVRDETAPVTLPPPQAFIGGKLYTHCLSCDGYFAYAHTCNPLSVADFRTVRERERVLAEILHQLRLFCVDRGGIPTNPGQHRRGRLEIHFHAINAPPNSITDDRVIKRHLVYVLDLAGLDVTWLNSRLQTATLTLVGGGEAHGYGSAVGAKSARYASAIAIDFVGWDQLQDAEKLELDIVGRLRGRRDRPKSGDSRRNQIHFNVEFDVGEGNDDFLEGLRRWEF